MEDMEDMEGLWSHVFFFGYPKNDSTLRAKVLDLNARPRLLGDEGGNGLVAYSRYFVGDPIKGEQNDGKMVPGIPHCQLNQLNDVWMIVETGG